MNRRCAPIAQHKHRSVTHRLRKVQVPDLNCRGPDAAWQAHGYLSTALPAVAKTLAARAAIAGDAAEAQQQTRGNHNGERDRPGSTVLTLPPPSVLDHAGLDLVCRRGG
jgi:hypothetical protein